MRSVIVAVLFLVLPLFAQRRMSDRSGTYKGEIQTTSGKVENTLVLKDVKGKITGTLTNQYGTLPLMDAAMDGDDLFFTVEVNDEGHPFRMVYRGHIFDNEFQFRIEAGERRLDLIAKKVS